MEKAPEEIHQSERFPTKQTLYDVIEDALAWDKPGYHCQVSVPRKGENIQFKT
jgi:hypothetical protein